MKKGLLLVLSLLTVLCLCSCGIAEPDSEEDPYHPAPPSGNTDSLEPVLDPSDDDWSWGYTEGYAGDRWYLNGNRENGSFSVQPDGNGHYFISFFDSENGSSSADCGFTVSGAHLVNDAGSERVFDFIFTDPFTAFDTVSGEYYLRGDYVSLFKALTSAGFRNTVHREETLFFRADGTAENICEDTSYPGTWRAESAHSLIFHDDETDTDLRFFYTYSQEDVLLGLTDVSGVLWETFSADP